MWQVSAQTVSSLSKSAYLDFEIRVLEHLQRCFPLQYVRLRENKTREFVASGVQAASQYGFKTERDVCRFLGIAYALGLGFEDKPQFSWAGSILRDTSLQPSEKIEKVHERLRVVLGRQ